MIALIADYRMLLKTHDGYIKCDRNLSHQAISNIF